MVEPRPETTDYFDVIAVNIETGAHRILEAKRTAKDANAIMMMDVMRRGFGIEFYKILPHREAHVQD